MFLPTSTLVVLEALQEACDKMKDYLPGTNGKAAFLIPDIL